MLQVPHVASEMQVPRTPSGYAIPPAGSFSGGGSHHHFTPPSQSQLLTYGSLSPAPSTGALGGGCGAAFGSSPGPSGPLGYGGGMTASGANSFNFGLQDTSSFGALGSTGGGGLSSSFFDNRGSFPALATSSSNNVFASSSRGSFSNLLGSQPSASFGALGGGAVGSSALATGSSPEVVRQSSAASFARSSSNIVTPNFQFKFEPGYPTISENGPSQVDRMLQSMQGTGDPSHAYAEGPAPAVACRPAARGREGVLKRLSAPTFGVAQEPVGCTAQLDECIAACRREVQAIAVEQRRRGQKYSDPDFPTDVRSLYINGRSPSGEFASLPQSEWPTAWKRASEGPLPAGQRGAHAARQQAHAAFPQQGANGTGAEEAYVPGPFGCTPLLGALSTMRAIGKDPRELIVWQEPDAGVYGVRFYKDGEWMYEILDDSVPMTGAGGAACSYSTTKHGETQDWVALIEKAYAKVHGSYEAAATSGEADAMEDVLGMGASRVTVNDFPIWGELWQHLRSKRQRGYALLAARRRVGEKPGEALTNGLVSYYGYPVTRLELIDGEMLCELENPWPIGMWHGRWGERSPEFARNAARLQRRAGGGRSFWMSIQDFCKHFSDFFEARMVSAGWQTASVIHSSERPSHPLLSVPSSSQAIFVLTQSDRHWAKQDEYTKGLGLRIYRCRVVAPPRDAVGVRQNVSSPFRNLELLVQKPITKARSVVAEVARLEPNCLYMAAIDAEYPCDFAMLRIFTAVPPRFRELSAPESQYFLQAQASAPQALEQDSFSSQGSADMNPAVSSPFPSHHSRGGQQGSREASVEREGTAETSSHSEPEEVRGTKIPKFLQALIATCEGPLQC
eukprot:TRINITY_DN74846_c0_g1_i1.p1 TRINITY_DN74846_c0_g1~~TRINITY_DN74846_c0_g1_i1.p1  ORF type:complete len:849 (+),score=154.38 TRINITY_DN74846_c0_g1_i1:147-2693(+)